MGFEVVLKFKLEKGSFWRSILVSLMLQPGNGLLSVERSQSALKSTVPLPLQCLIGDKMFDFYGSNRKHKLNFENDILGMAFSENSTRSQSAFKLDRLCWFNSPSLFLVSHSRHISFNWNNLNRTCQNLEHTQGERERERSCLGSQNERLSLLDDYHSLRWLSLSGSTVLDDLFELHAVVPIITSMKLLHNMKFIIENLK